MNRAERRERRNKKVKQRSDLIKALNRWLDKDESYYGKLANNNEMNAVMSRGKSIKTNTRKGHSNYRRKGSFGPANNYCHRDAKQIESMNSQIKDINKENE